MNPLRLRVHAKLNLALRVGQPRADGYHPIAGVFQTISLCDLMYAAADSDGDADLLRLDVAGSRLPADNTVAVAVDKLAVEARQQGIEPRPLRIRLVKRVPMGAGLGGGSSDAVAAMAAGVRLWDVDGERLSGCGALRRIAAEVGSDVPFFLVGGTAMVSGVGDVVAPLTALEHTWFVVAAPDLHVSTPAAYAEFDRAAGAGSSPAPGAPPLPPYRPRLQDDWMGNDLEVPVSALSPQVAQVRRRLAALGARFVQMTGSGAASFGAFPDRASAARAARSLAAEGYWAGAFVTVSAAAHRRGLFGRH